MNLVTLGEALLASFPSPRVLGSLPPALVASLASPDAPPLDSATAFALLGEFGIGGGELPERMAPLLALISALPAALTERLLTELIARTFEA